MRFLIISSLELEGPRVATIFVLNFDIFIKGPFLEVFFGFIEPIFETRISLVTGLLKNKCNHFKIRD